MVDLYRHSFDVILGNQAPSGAYVACPNFPNYRYSWFRDSSFIAYALDLNGSHASSARYHQWVAEVVTRREALIHQAIAASAAGKMPDGSTILHTRYTLDGEEAKDDGWQNNQLDGFGTWLWELEQHSRLSGKSLPVEWLHTAGLVAAYLEALWRFPCADCWEEHPDMVHAHTLAAIYGGLAACSHLDGVDRGPTLAQIREMLTSKLVYQGHFVKSIGTQVVDASLISLAVPYRVVEPDDSRMQATIRKIEADLTVGGVHRYPTDTYYGGGEWVLLAGWLGWYHAAAGNRERAMQLAAWMEAQADGEGNLPEQVPQSLIDPQMYQPWVDRWGQIARPLLWSHAKYLILRHFLEE
jgi:GH15 family glucan-1,4-alpha-glucosidase